MDHNARLRRALVRWYRRHRRDLPWRRTRDPYRIWVAEIMLQQTRVRAVLPYYERFLERFASLEALAAARQEQVLAAWSGLGYYSRARNLWRAARQMNGAFPRDYAALRALPGVGDYTAAAVASIAFGLPHAVLDGNVLRVASRLLDEHGEIRSARTRARLAAFVEALLPRRGAGTFNQAMMELGATVCLPRAPLCSRCPVARSCAALARGTAGELPVRGPRPSPVRIDARLALAERGQRILFARRNGFWELPAPEALPGFEALGVAGAFRHTITHHHYNFTVVTGHVARASAGMSWVSKARLREVAIGATARKALRLAGILS